MTAPTSTPKARGRNILKMISSTLKNVKGKRRNAADRRKRGQSVDTKDSVSTISLCESSAFSEHDDMSVFSHDSLDSIERIQEKAEELQRELQGAFDSYTEKEQTVSKAKVFHMDRARGRFEGRNQTGAILSMRKLMQIEKEYEHVNDSLQYFSFRKLELDRFLMQIRATLKAFESGKEAEKEKLYNALETQCAKVCSSLDDIKSVLEEPDVEIGTCDADLLKELATRINGSEDTSEFDFDDDDSSYESDEDSDFDDEEDEELLQELSHLVVASTA
eukprot:CAMPEP_0172449572 /NCGR_PEP_ID=MMETSP1065-20121228/8253_1 /TAXON_ID=265537 /ORGANISM="Amphiprora paludosa, Strain CCMP125" /LENGTH=275 /DNA_ID=CAMNT_0013201275 /DNA_START=26 /DNA_END=853 /DNA_ORIENTATION=-